MTLILYFEHGNSQSQVYLQFGPGTQNPSVEIVNITSKTGPWPCRLNLLKVEQK